MRLAGKETEEHRVVSDLAGVFQPLRCTSCCLIHFYAAFFLSRFGNKMPHPMRDAGLHVSSAATHHTRRAFSISPRDTIRSVSPELGSSLEGLWWALVDFMAGRVKKGGLQEKAITRHPRTCSATMLESPLDLMSNLALNFSV
jgi:hypothetical protein